MPLMKVVPSVYPMHEVPTEFAYMNIRRINKYIFDKYLIL